MKKIKIFVAGSLSLKSARSRIKKVDEPLNDYYKEKGYVINIYSSDNLQRDSQHGYNQFIVNEADIVVFIIGDHIGPNTEEEFIYATRAHNKHDRPKIIVLRENQHGKELTPEISRIEGLIKGSLCEKFWISYSDNDELRDKAYEQIKSKIEEIIVENKARSFKTLVVSFFKKLRALDFHLKVLIGSLLLIIAFLTGFIFKTSVSAIPAPGLPECDTVYISNISKSDLLLFSGSGSVRNYIASRNNPGLDIDTLSNSVYADLPSGATWELLVEEARRRVKGYDVWERGHPIVCFAASDLDNEFIRSNNELFRESHVLKYYLGEDTLFAYVSDELLKEDRYAGSKDSISVELLRTLVKDGLNNPTAMRIFTTSKTSGTLQAYQSLFEADDSVKFDDLLDKKSVKWFQEDMDALYINGDGRTNNDLPYIVLCSKYYFPKELSNGFKPLMVVDGGNAVTKPLLLYFIASKRKDGSGWYVKTPVLKFLKAIDANKNIKLWNDLEEGKFRIDQSQTIFPINEDK